MGDISSWLSWLRRARGSALWSYSQPSFGVSAFQEVLSETRFDTDIIYVDWVASLFWHVNLKSFLHRCLESLRSREGPSFLAPYFEDFARHVVSSLIPMLIGRLHWSRWPPGFCAGTLQQHYRVLCRSCTTKQVRQCVCMCLLHLWSRPTERLEASGNLCKFQSRQIQVLPESRSTTLVQDLDLHSCDLSHLAAVPLSATGTSYFQSMTCLGRSVVSVLRPLPFEATCEGTQGSQKAFV